MNVSEIPQTPENIITVLAVIFVIGILILIVWSAYQYFTK